MDVVVYSIDWRYNVFESHLFVFDVKVRSLNLFLWRHLERISFLLLSKLFPSWIAISTFSLIQRLHFCVSGVYDEKARYVFHLRSYCFCKFFNLHISVANSESVLYTSWLKDFLWFAYRSLNVVVHMPMYLFVP